MRHYLIVLRIFLTLDITSVRLCLICMIRSTLTKWTKCYRRIQAKKIFLRENLCNYKVLIKVISIKAPKKIKSKILNFCLFRLLINNWIIKKTQSILGILREMNFKNHLWITLNHHSYNHHHINCILFKNKITLILLYLLGVP
jgi:hypothetical protein